jgi:hypothetical protein
MGRKLNLWNDLVNIIDLLAYQLIVHISSFFWRFGTIKMFGFFCGHVTRLGDMTKSDDGVLLLKEFN